MLEVLYHRAKFGGSRITAKNVKFLSVHLFVHHALKRQLYGQFHHEGLRVQN